MVHLVSDPAVIAGISIGVVLLIGNAVIIVLSRKSLTCFEETKNEGASHTGAMQNTQDASIYSGLQDNECDKQIYTGLKSFEKSPTECNSEYQGLQMRSTQVYEDLNISSIKTPTEPNAGDLHVYEN
ncbi:uncharacterized protein LOC124254614 [Haliotis rubra]|uniref:uncharacterized protein LOC124254614 n=1 Tax=Haliotis rubra TaxID=36100 RepID=UPI001EE5B361|nr:uncharacterized protein LOC124254614 [Haliotis rubra]